MTRESTCGFWIKGLRFCTQTQRNLLGFDRQRAVALIAEVNQIAMKLTPHLHLIIIIIINNNNIY